MLKKTIYNLTFLALLASCTKGQLPDFSNEKLVESQFIDAPVKGIQYKTNSEGSEKLSTGDNGLFNCEKGDILEFFIQDLSLGHAPCGDKIFVQDLSPSPSSELSWIQVASLIQSLSVSREDSSLDLTNTPIPNTINGIDSSNFESLIESIHSTILASSKKPHGFPSSIVSLEDAEIHANNSLKDFANVENITNANLNLINAYGATRLYASLNKENSHEVCWHHYILDTSIKTETVESKSFKKFEISKVFGFDGAYDLDDELNCQDTGDNDRCEIIDSSRTPNSRYITSNAISLLFKDYESTLNMSSILSITLNGSSSDEKAKGDFITYATENSKAEKCNYSISDKIPLNLTDYDSKGGAGLFEGNLQCSESGDPLVLAVSLDIKPKASSTYGYVASLTIVNEDETTFYRNQEFELVNDEETPDDMPFLYHSSSINGVSWYFNGYHDQWSSDGPMSFKFNVIAGDSNIQCSSINLARK